MTTQQEHLIRQAIGALKAALGGQAPEIPFPAEARPQEPELADLKKKHHNTKEVLRILFAKYGHQPIKWGTGELKRLAFDRNIWLDGFINKLEDEGIVAVEREPSPAGTKKFIRSFRFVKRIS